MAHFANYPDISRFAQAELARFDPTALRRLALAAWFVLVALLAAVDFVLPLACKLRLRRPLRAVQALAFFCLVGVLDGARSMAFTILPLLLIVFLNVRLVRDCPACGMVVRSASPFTAANYCPSCGADMRPRRRPDLRAGLR